MPMVIMLGILGAAMAFLLFVLVNFWREATGPGRRGQHLKVMPFCIACTQGWPHELKIVPEDALLAQPHSRVLKMPHVSCKRTTGDSLARMEREVSTARRA